MGREIDLMVNYPKTRRDPLKRAESKTAEDRAVARRFGREFFDGERRHGYGGYRYNPRFWQPVVPTFREHFGLGPSSSVLDVGCGKGFMLHDLAQMIPGIKVAGVDISEYGVANTIEDTAGRVLVADAAALPFPARSFDVVICITTVHNLDRDGCGRALAEIERVARGRSFITVDAYRNDEEKVMMEAWNLTAKTVMHVDEWKKFFREVGYTGDYYWFIP